MRLGHLALGCAEFSGGERILRDLRDFARKTNTRLVIGFVLILLVIGDGLIYLIYGKNAAITGFICILGGFVPILLIIGLFALMDIVIKRANEED